MEPVPLSAAGESEPFSRKNPALSPGERLQVRRERPVEPVPQTVAGESEPFSPESPALSPEVETADAARDACGAGTPAGHGGK